MKDLQDIIIELEHMEDVLSKMESNKETLEEMLEELRGMTGTSIILEAMDSTIYNMGFDIDNLKIEIAELEEEGREIADRL